MVLFLGQISNLPILMVLCLEVMPLSYVSSGCISCVVLFIDFASSQARISKLWHLNVASESTVYKCN